MAGFPEPGVGLVISFSYLPARPIGLHVHPGSAAMRSLAQVIGLLPWREANHRTGDLIGGHELGHAIYRQRCQRE